MNELKQIRTMAEMILEKVDALEGATPRPQNGFSEFGPKFKVGDRVCTTVGEAGKITGIHKLDGHYRYRYLVLFDNGDHHHVVEPLLELSKPDPKFKVGDRVLCPDDDGIGTVTAVYNEGTGGIACTIQFPSDYGCYTREYYQSDLKLVEEKPKFKVGDRVVYDFDGTTKIGTVAKLIGGGWYVVDWDDGTGNSMNESFNWVRLATKEDREWHSGPPPHIGWWNASTNADPNNWRWWNGTAWSTFCTENMSLPSIARLAAHIEFNKQCIKWTDYWPANARVPRIDPGVQE